MKKASHTKILPSLNTQEDALLGNPMGSDGPFYLYTAVTSYPRSVDTLSTIENNKQSVIENISEKGREKILVVDGGTDIRYLLKDILQDDYIIYEAENAQKALEFINRTIPDLVICDVSIPNMNGLDLCKKIKNTPISFQIPIILLSAKSSEDQHMEGYEVGADAYIAKPFNIGHLKLRVRKLLEYRQKLHDLFANKRNADPLPEGDDDQAFLHKLVQVIGEKLEERELNTVFIEKAFILSKMQLYRKLKAITGMTPGEFIKRIRLKHAAQFLVSSHYTVSEIFYRTGFNNQSYFFREFKKRYNCTPNEYREQQSAIA